MSSTYNDVRAAIEGRIATQMALPPAYPVSYQNVPFTPQGQGTAANFTIAERLKDLFDRAKFSSIIFDAASGPAQITPAAPEPYFQTQLTATFEAYLD